MNINGEDWLLIISIAYCTILIIAWAYFHISSRMRERKNNRARIEKEVRKQFYAYWGIHH